MRDKSQLLEARTKGEPHISIFCKIDKKMMRGYIYIYIYICAGSSVVRTVQGKAKPYWHTRECTGKLYGLKKFQPFFFVIFKIKYGNGPLLHFFGILFGVLDISFKLHQTSR
jgi:hypothetical protein